MLELGDEEEAREKGVVATAIIDADSVASDKTILCASYDGIVNDGETCRNAAKNPDFGQNDRLKLRKMTPIWAHFGLMLRRNSVRVRGNRMKSELNIRAVASHEAGMGGRAGPWAGFDRTAARIIDIVVSVVALIFFLPLMLVVAAAVYLADPGPIFFAQNRIGLRGRTFRCFKFRTMAVNAEERLQELLANDPAAREEWDRDHKLKNDPRIVGIGSFLRKSSFDELPQLFNVLKGEMSLVGPRPIVPAEASRYGRYFLHYCSVRPGITGLWQISGRNDTTYRRRVAFDVAYSRSQSAMLNMRIIVMTVPSVLMAKGSY